MFTWANALGLLLRALRGAVGVRGRVIGWGGESERAGRDRVMCGDHRHGGVSRSLEYLSIGMLGVPRIAMGICSGRLAEERTLRQWFGRLAGLCCAQEIYIYTSSACPCLKAPGMQAADAKPILWRAVNGVTSCGC